MSRSTGPVDEKKGDERREVKVEWSSLTGDKPARETKFRWHIRVSEVRPGKNLRGPSMYNGLGKVEIDGDLEEAHLFADIIRDFYPEKYKEYFPHDKYSPPRSKRDKALDAYFVSVVSSARVYMRRLYESMTDVEEKIENIKSALESVGDYDWEVLKDKKKLSKRWIGIGLTSSEVANKLVKESKKILKQEYKGAVFPSNELIEAMLEYVADFFIYYGHSSEVSEIIDVMTKYHPEMICAMRLWFLVLADDQFCLFAIGKMTLTLENYNVKYVKKFKSLISTQPVLQLKLVQFVERLEEKIKSYASGYNDRFPALIKAVKALVPSEMFTVTNKQGQFIPSQSKSHGAIIPNSNMSTSGTLKSIGVASSMPTQSLTVSSQQSVSYPTGPTSLAQEQINRIKARPLTAAPIPSQPQQGEGQTMPSAPPEQEEAPPPSYNIYAYGSTNGNGG